MKLTQLTPKGYAVTELPEVTYKLKIIGKRVLVWQQPKEDLYNGSFKLPPGNWTLLGRAADLTEDQWKLVVPQYKAVITSYLDYTTGHPDTLVETAIEAGHSAVKAAGLFVSNPYDKPDNACDSFSDSMNLDDLIDEWQAAQLLTNPLILIKE